MKTTRTFIFSALLATAAVVVLPYRTATQSGVLNRAVAAGAAVVATDLPGLRADLLRVRLVDGQPVIRGIWVNGNRQV